MDNSSQVKNRVIIAGLLTILLGPTIGMLYANRGKLALFYLAVEVLWVLISYLVIPILALAGTLAIRLYGLKQIAPIVKEQDRQEKCQWFSHLWVIALLIIIPLSGAFAFRTYLYEPFQQNSDSMMPNIASGDYFFVNKRAYKSEQPQRGDVIAFTVNGLRDPWIKRVIGLPGEKIQIKQGVVYINDVALLQKRLDDYTVTEINGAQKKISQFRETLPEGSSYNILLGKPDEAIENTDIFMIPPHAYFVIGDNRDNSRDSRYPTPQRYIAQENIIGEIDTIWWNSRMKSFGKKPIP